MSEFKVGEEYDFSNDGVVWVKGKLIRCTSGITTDYYCIKGLGARFTHIREVKPELPKPSNAFNLERALAGDIVIELSTCSEVSQFSTFKTNNNIVIMGYVADTDTINRFIEDELVMAPKMLKGFVGVLLDDRTIGPFNSRNAMGGYEDQLKAIIDLSTIEEGCGL